MIDIRQRKSLLMKLESYLLLLIFFLPLDVPAETEKKNLICFYNPEANINNYTSLKKQFNLYLSRNTNYVLQPFSNQRVFNNYIKKCKKCIFLLSRWHYESLKSSILIEATLSGTFQGKTTQNRILSLAKGVQGIEDLWGKTIASASSEEYTRNVLRLMLGKDKKELLDTFKVLTVPKDIDALLAVNFGMSSAALTTENSLKKLREINKIQAEMLTVVAPALEKTPLPVLALWKEKKNDVDIEELVNVLISMRNAKEGQQILSLLGLDGFQTITKAK